MPTTKHIKISDAAKTELRNARISGNRLDLPPNLKNYAELKKIFAEIGVVWHKKDKTHYLGENSQEQINFILEGGKLVDEKKTLQAFFTPHSLAEKVVEIADVKDKTVLEPSCGEGSLFFECIKQKCDSVYGVEIESKFISVLQAKIKLLPKNKIYTIFNQDFLKFPPENARFDRVVMNPPFDRNLWIRHIEHSWKFLKENGKLVSICPNSPQNSALKKFLAGKNHEIIEVDKQAFKESGTLVSTMILVVNKY